MNGTDLIKKYMSMYRGVTCELTEELYLGYPILKFRDTKTGTVHRMYSFDQLGRIFREIGKLRTACGIN